MMTDALKRTATAVGMAALGVGSAVAIPPALSGGPAQITGAAPQAIDQYGAGTQGGPIDPAAAAALSASIEAAIAALPADASPADIEAAIVFAIDQANQPLGVALAALAAVDATRLTPGAQTALATVRANRARTAQRGTGSIAGGADIGLAFGPDLSVSGGSSDYSG